MAAEEVENLVVEVAVSVHNKVALVMELVVVVT